MATKDLYNNKEIELSDNEKFKAYAILAGCFDGYRIVNNVMLASDTVTFFHKSQAGKFQKSFYIPTEKELTKEEEDKIKFNLGLTRENQGNQFLYDLLNKLTKEDAEKLINYASSEFSKMKDGNMKRFLMGKISVFTELNSIRENSSAEERV